MKVLEDVVTKQNTLKGAVKQRAQEAALNAALDAINKTKSTQKGNTPARQVKSKQQKKEAYKRTSTLNCETAQWVTLICLNVR